MTDAGQTFLLRGPEESDKAAFIEKRIDLCRSKNAVPEIHRFYPFESSMVDIIALLQNGSLFSNHRIVIINDVEKFKKSEEISLLADYMKKPAPNATLFLLSRTTRDKDISKKIQAPIPKQNAIIFWEMFENRRMDWIRRFFRERKIDIDAEASAFLLEMIQNNTRNFEEECGRLAGFFGEGAQLRLEHLEQYIYHSKEENVFTLFEKIAARDLAASQEILAKILLSGESEASGIPGGLLWQIRRLLQMKELLEQNYSLNEAFARLKLRGKKNQNIYIGANKNYSRIDAQRLVMLIADYEKRLRSGGADLSRLLLELLVYYAIVHGGKVPENPAL